MDLYSMIEAGGNIKVEVSAADLCQFADKLIEKAQLMKEHELMRQEQAADEEKWLSTEEACDVRCLHHHSLGMGQSWLSESR